MNQHLSTFVLTHTRFSSSCSDFKSSNISEKLEKMWELTISLFQTLTWNQWKIHLDCLPMQLMYMSMYMNMRVNIWHLGIDLITLCKNKLVQPRPRRDESDDSMLKLCLLTCMFHDASTRILLVGCYPEHNCKQKIALVSTHLFSANSKLILKQSLIRTLRLHLSRWRPSSESPWTQSKNQWTTHYQRFWKLLLRNSNKTHCDWVAAKLVSVLSATFYLFNVQVPLSFYILLLTFFGNCVFNCFYMNNKSLRCNNVTFHSLEAWKCAVEMVTRAAKPNLYRFIH